VWVEDESRWHGDGVAAAQQHVAVSVRPEEAGDRVTMNCPARTQRSIGTWGEAGKLSGLCHMRYMNSFSDENYRVTGGDFPLL